MTAVYSFFGFIIQALIVSIMLALPTEGQNMKDVRISVMANNITLGQAFKLVEQKTNFRFIYNVNEIPLNDKINKDLANESLYNLLETLAKDHGLTFSRINEQIIVRKSDGQKENLVVSDDKGVIKGKVSEASSGEPLVGASIAVKATQQGAITDINGNYKIENVKPGRYVISVTYVGYSAITKTIVVFANETAVADFAVKESAIDLDDVVVTGSFSQREKRELANPVTVISMNTIKQTMPAVTNLTDILSNNVPGYFQDVANEFTFGSNLNPILRGSSSSSGKQLVIYIDGVPVSNESYKPTTTLNVVAFNGQPPTSQQQDINKLVNVNDIERIEVLRGPMASTLYGSGAGNGVINIITKKSTGSKTRFSFQGTLSTISDIYSDTTPLKNNLVLGLSGGSGQIGYTLGVSRLQREYTYTPAAIPRYTNFSVNGGTKVNLDPVMVDLRFDYITAESGAQSVSKMWQGYSDARGWTSFPAASASNSKTDNNTFNASIIVKHIISSNWYHSLMVGYNLYSQDLYDYVAPTSTNKWNIINSLMKKNSIRYFTNYNTNVIDKLKFDFTGGIEFWKSTYDNTSLSTAKPYDSQLASQLINTTTGRKTFRKDENYGYFGEMVLGYNNQLFLTGGLRIEKNTNITANNGIAQAPRVGLSYVQNMGDVVLKPRISYGSTINPPRWEQVIGSVSTSVTVLPNQDLKAEQNSGYELGVDLYYQENYSLELTYYNQTGTDLIFVEILPTEPGLPGQQQYRNVGKVINQGLEMAGSAFLDPVMFRMTLSYMDNRYGSNFQGFNEGDKVINTPKLTLNGSLSYTLPDFLNLVDKQSSISLQIQYRGPIITKDLLVYYDGLYKPGAQSVSSSALPYIDTGSYTLLNVSANYWITNYLQALVDIRNLFDKQIVSGQFYPIIGREITIGLKTEL